MIRFITLLYFFVHVAVMVKAPRYKWLSRAIGYGIPAFFIWLVVSSAEPNSNIVFIILAILGALAIVLAELIASGFKKEKN